MKKTILIIALAITSYGLKAQATIESIVIQKHNRNAVKLYIDQPVDITADALSAKLKRSGLNGNKKKGVTVYKGVTLSEISTTKLDIYTRIQKFGIGTVVYMAASKGYDNFTSPEDPEITDKIVAFLNTFVADANYRSVDIDLTTQNDIITKQEKAFQKLLEEQKDTQKKKEEAEIRLIKLENDIETKKTEIDKLKSELESLKIKRTNIN